MEKLILNSALKLPGTSPGPGKNYPDYFIPMLPNTSSTFLKTTLQKGSLHSNCKIK